MNTPRSLLFFLCALILGTPLFAGGWGDDYKAALATASKEHKKVLLNFTGSDWCGWCIRLKKETFDKPAFKDFADKNLVLVDVDFPRGKSLTPEVVAQNADLRQQFQVSGLPFLILLDSEGKEINENRGYLPGGPQGFIDWVKSSK
jgi:thioredoxin-related protein